MKRAIQIPFALAFLSLVAGCKEKQSGTCLDEPGGVKTCTVNAEERTCQGSGRQFYKEDTTAGLLRCKSAGFINEAEMDASNPMSLHERIAKGARVSFSKP